MSGRRGTTVEIDNREHSPKAIARKSRKPVGAALLIAFILADEKYLHLLHDLLGPGSGAFAAILFLFAVLWGYWRLMRRIG